MSFPLFPFSAWTLLTKFKHNKSTNTCLKIFDRHHLLMLMKVVSVETNLLLVPAPPTKRFWGYLSLILFKVIFFLATTQTSPPFPPSPPRRGRPIPPLPPRTYRRRLSTKFPYCRQKKRDYKNLINSLYQCPEGTKLIQSLHTAAAMNSKLTFGH